MVYRVLGLMSGSSLDGLDLAFVELTENGGAWGFEIVAADCYAYEKSWVEKLSSATQLSARDYLLLHADYGHYTGTLVNRFIEEKAVHYQIGFIASHGHTTFHEPQLRMTAQLGDGAAIAAATGLPVVSDLRALDVAFGGQGAPIVPIGEQLLWPQYPLFLNIGGIANIAFHDAEKHIAFDVCPANRVLNLLAAQAGKGYDDGGAMAAAGQADYGLLKKLDALDYYQRPAPKSLANHFGTDVIFPLIEQATLSTEDALHTYVLHIAAQVKNAVAQLFQKPMPGVAQRKMLVTGGGAFNHFLVHEISHALQPYGIEVIVPEEAIVQYKEAIVMALIGALRWRQESTVIASVTGAVRASIGGALWIGQEA